MATKEKKPLSPLDALAKKHKLPTVVDLVNKSLETIGITYLAKDLDYDYTNLNKVAKGAIKLPLNPTILLARMHGFTDEQGVWINAYQHITDPDAEPKSRAPRRPRAVAKPAK